jgi:hypothetical protein
LFVGGMPITEEHDHDASANYMKTRICNVAP